MQYLQIDFAKPVALYGVIIRGSPIFDQFVTSYKIMHSFDGIAYHYLLDYTSTPQIFSGPVDKRSEVKSDFKIAIEARIVRIYPLTWHDSIAIRLELLGCGATKTTIPPVVFNKHHQPTTIIVEDVPTEAPPMYCEEPLGLANGAMMSGQIEVSSSKSSFARSKPNYVLESLKLTSLKGWSPHLDTLSEFVLFDFLEPRHVFGVITKGGEYGWVTAYKVFYSNDKFGWSPIQTSNGMARIFLANFDSTSEKLNKFDLGILARYVKLVPTKWHDAIELKVELIGCFKPYRKNRFYNLEIFIINDFLFSC